MVFAAKAHCTCVYLWVCVHMYASFLNLSWTDLQTDLVLLVWIWIAFTCLAVHFSAVWARAFWRDVVSWGLHRLSKAASSHKASPSSDTSPSPRATRCHICSHTAPAHTLHLMILSSDAQRHTESTWSQKEVESTSCLDKSVESECSISRSVWYHNFTELAECI